jgi:hypothetical protein
MNTDTYAIWTCTQEYLVYDILYAGVYEYWQGIVYYNRSRLLYKPQRPQLLQAVEQTGGHVEWDTWCQWGLQPA